MSKVEMLSTVIPEGFPTEWYDIATENHFWLEWRKTAFLEQLQNLHIPIDKPLKGLEIGCGHGILRKQIEENTNWSIDGADMNLEALKQAPPSTQGRTLFYNIHDRNNELSERYDFLILFDVIEHIEDPSSFLDSALFHLAPGGWVFINVPAINQISSVYDQVVGHFRRYDKKMMRNELHLSGFNILDLRYWGMSMVPLLFLRKLLLSRQTDTDQIIENGFKPPSDLAHSFLKLVMKIEISLTSKPPIGTSLLALAQKNL